MNLFHWHCYHFYRLYFYSLQWQAFTCRMSSYMVIVNIFPARGSTLLLLSLLLTVCLILCMQLTESDVKTGVEFLACVVFTTIKPLLILIPVSAKVNVLTVYCFRVHSKTISYLCFKFSPRAFILYGQILVLDGQIINNNCIYEL